MGPVEKAAAGPPRAAAFSTGPQDHPTIILGVDEIILGVDEASQVG